MILHRYFARRFFWSLAMVFGILTLIMWLVDLVGDLQDYTELAFPKVLQLTFLRLPAKSYEILPLAVVLATVALFVRLARTSELVVVRAAGRSGLVSVMAPVAVVALVGVLGLTSFNPIVAATARRHNDLVNDYFGGGSAIMVLANEGLWLRQGGPDGQTVIHAERASSDLTVLFGTTFLDFASDGTPVRRIKASAARLREGEWVLYDVKLWELAQSDNPEATAVELEQLRLASALTHDRIIDSFGKPEYIPIWELPAFIAQLEQAGFSARRYAMWYQMELARPLFLMALVIISAALTMRPARLSNTGLSVLAAVMLGFGLHYLRNFAQILGENGQIPIHLAAWAPPVASFLLATGLLLHMEDG